VNTLTRDDRPLLRDGVAAALLASGRPYEGVGRWFLWLMLIMPDHVHLIATFDLSRGIRSTVAGWKRFHAGRSNIRWQPGFFEHRLRNDAEFVEKAHYVRMNPVRKGLVASPEAWPCVIDAALWETAPYPAPRWHR
jgi:hypothetical protein